MWFYGTCSLSLFLREFLCFFFFCNISVIWLKISGHKLHPPLFQQPTILFCFRIDLKCKLWTFLSWYGAPHVCLNCNILWDYVPLECSQRKLIVVVTFHIHVSWVWFSYVLLKGFCIQNHFFLHVHVVIVFLFLFFSFARRPWFCSYVWELYHTM